MEVSKEALLDELNDFEKKRPGEIPPPLEEYLGKIAKTGDTLRFPWPKVKVLVQKKLEIVMSEFYESCPTDSLSNIPNVDSFKFEVLKDKILEAIDSFNSAPFTIQRICELITSPKKHYKRTDKFMRGLEKNILVVSTVEPSSARRLEVNNNGNLLINGVLEVSPNIGDLLSPDNNANAPSTSLANHSLASNNSLDNDPSNFTTQSIVNGALDDKISASLPSSSSLMIVSSASMFPTDVACPTIEPTQATGDSESSSSSDSDSSSDSLTTDYPKDILAADSTSRRISSNPPVTLSPQQPFVAADQPCTSQAQAMMPTSELNAMDTTPDHPPTKTIPLRQTELPEETVSSSDVRLDAVPLGTVVDESMVLNNGNLLVADSTDGNLGARSLNVSTNERGNIAIGVPESSIVDPGLSLGENFCLGDELSVVKEVAENLVETLLNQNVTSATEVPTGIILPGLPTSSQEIANKATTIEGEVTSLNLEIPDVAVHFSTNIVMLGDEAQSTLSEKIEISDNIMETELTLGVVASSTSSVTTSSQSIINAQPLLSSPSLAPLPDQSESEPMEQD